MRGLRVARGMVAGALGLLAAAPGSAQAPSAQEEYDAAIAQHLFEGFVIQVPAGLRPGESLRAVGRQVLAAHRRAERASSECLAVRSYVRALRAERAAPPLLEPQSLDRAVRGLSRYPGWRIAECDGRQGRRDPSYRPLGPGELDRLLGPPVLGITPIARKR